MGYAMLKNEQVFPNPSVTTFFRAGTLRFALERKKALQQLVFEVMQAQMQAQQMFLIHHVATLCYMKVQHSIEQKFDSGDAVVVSKF